MESTMQFILLFFSIPLLASAGKFRCDYQYVREGNGWFKLHAEPMTWSQAAHTCFLEGADLATPAFTDIADVLLMIVYEHDDVDAIHTGLHPTCTYANDINEKLQLPRYSCDWRLLAIQCIQEINSCIYILLERMKEVILDEESFVFNRKGSFIRISQQERYPFICHRRAEEDVHLNECGMLDNGYKLDNRTGQCYKFHRLRDTWYQARITCMDEEGHLAVINSEEEAQVIRDIFAANPSNTIPGDDWLDSAFLGFRSLDEGRNWITIFDERLSQAGYDNFSPREPNNARGDEFCGSVGRNGLLFDDPCTRRFPFICEKKTTRPCDVPATPTVVTPRKHKYDFAPSSHNDVFIQSIMEA